MEGNLTTTLLIMGLPIILLYLLVAVRSIEKVLLRERDHELGSEHEPSLNVTFYQVVDVRDAALVTLAVDLAAFVTSYTTSDVYSPSYADIYIILVAIVFHVTGLIGSLYWMKMHPGESFFEKVTQLYLSLILLLTNAITLKGIVGMEGIIGILR